MEFNIQKIREDFPILTENIYGKPLVYFDNGATTQKPRSVIDKINHYHTHLNSSIHRGVHYLSEKMTNDYEAARHTIAKFIHAKKASEIIFTSGTTGSINGLAFSFGEKYIQQGDEIILTQMEHHANIIPWQMMCERKGAVIKVLPFSQNGELELELLPGLISEKTKLIGVVHVSNSLGTINPVKKIIHTAHQHNIPVLVDGAQAVQHQVVDINDLDADFYAFSGHKIYGPTGIGILYGKEKYLEELPPFQGGGDMVDRVTFEKTTYNELPFKFEAGTTNYIGAIGLAEALDYLLSIGIEKIQKYESQLLEYGTKKLSAIDEYISYGAAKHKTCIFSFHLGNHHPYDVGMILDKLGIAVRTGTHCCQPVMHRYGITGTIRASLAFYNTMEEIDLLCHGLLKASQMLS